jgi:1,4-alpha-glucan branching enzyme
MATNSKRTGTAGTQAVEFKCHAADAQQVFVAGTFNDWKPDATPLVRDKADNWRGSLKLTPGHHEFKFVVDGQWCCDPGCTGDHACTHCVPNEFGSMNRVLEVP